MVGADIPDAYFGWSTSGDHYGANGVYRDLGGQWAQLEDPLTSSALDLAFVLSPEVFVEAPEPATLILFGLGAIGLTHRKKK